MKAIRIFFLSIIGLNFLQTSSAQVQSVHQDGEWGISGGAPHYFGDLNPNMGLQIPKRPVGGVFFRKQFGNYVAARLSFHYTWLGYRNGFVPQTGAPQTFGYRSLKELAIHTDFNFFEFNPHDEDHRFTPYLTVGLGATQIGLVDKLQFCFPLGGGVKKAITNRTNIGLEIVHRFTSTDLIDAVVGDGFIKQKDQYLFAELTLAFNLTSDRCPKAN